MMGHREKLDGMGEDALTRAKRFYHFNPGVRAWVKRRFGKRERKNAKAGLRGFANERTDYVNGAHHAS